MAKAGRPKSGGNKLPDWFNINKYKCTKTFGAKDWSEQLDFRKNLFLAFDFILDKENGVCQEYIDRLTIVLDAG